MKVFKTFLTLSLAVVLTILFQGLVNENSVPENSEINPFDISKSVRVTVRIGKGGGCNPGVGVCRVIIRNNSEGNDIETLGANEIIGTVKWNKSTFDITTSSELMKQSTYSQYFSGSTFVMEDDYTIEKNSINNKKPFTLKAGTYNIEDVNGQKQISFNYASMD